MDRDRHILAAGWLRDEITLNCHPSDSPLSWLGLWQRARFVVWMLSFASLFFGALILGDVVYRLFVHNGDPVLAETLSGLVSILIGLIGLKILVARIGV